MPTDPFVTNSIARFVEFGLTAMAVGIGWTLGCVLVAWSWGRLAIIKKDRRG